MSFITMRAQEHHHDEMKMKDLLIKELEEKVRILNAVKDKEVWYWQGDGEDYPESLSCPVVMTADQLRIILGELDYLRESNKTLHIEVETLKEDASSQRYMKARAREQRDRMTDMVERLLSVVDNQTRKKFEEEMKK